MEGLSDYYDAGHEFDRLSTPRGVVEFERTLEILQRELPAPPAAVADIGGGPGAYAVWLAEHGYEVQLRDLMPSHVERASRLAGERGLSVDARAADARDLDLPDGSADAVLLMGPLYHLENRDDRLRALAEAGRIGRPGAPIFVAAISRWATRLDVVYKRLYADHPILWRALAAAEESGYFAPLFQGSFTAYTHRPGELREEIEAAGLECIDLVSVEGISFFFDDLDARLEDPDDRLAIFEAARALERTPELLGLGPHLLATARRGALTRE